MPEVLTVFGDRVADDLGTYEARAVGRQTDAGMWEGWIEFVPDGGGEVLVTGVETTQPEHTHLAYWAAGLTPIYLEGALRRARTPTTVRVRVTPQPASDAPARRVVSAPPTAPPTPAAVLDPFEIGGRSLDVLAQELRALNRPRLVNVIQAYTLNPGGEDIGWMSDEQLVRFIVVAVETQMAQRAR